MINGTWKVWMIWMFIWMANYHIMLEAFTIAKLLSNILLLSNFILSTQEIVQNKVSCLVVVQFKITAWDSIVSNLLQFYTWLKQYGIDCNLVHLSLHPTVYSFWFPWNSFVLADTILDTTIYVCTTFNLCSFLLTMTAVICWSKKMSIVASRAGAKATRACHQWSISRGFTSQLRSLLVFCLESCFVFVIIHILLLC